MSKNLGFKLVMGGNSKCLVSAKESESVTSHMDTPAESNKKALAYTILDNCMEKNSL